MAKLIDPAVRGWMNYYGRYYRTECIAVLQHINEALARWAARRISDALGTATEMHAMKNYAGHRLSPWLGHLMVSRQDILE